MTARERLIRLMDDAMAANNRNFEKTLTAFEGALIRANDFGLAWELCVAVRGPEMRRLFAERLAAARKQNGAASGGRQPADALAGSASNGGASKNADGKGGQTHAETPVAPVASAIGSRTPATTDRLNPASRVSPTAATPRFSEAGVAATLSVARRAWSPHLRCWEGLTIGQLEKAAAIDEHFARFKRLLIEAAEHRTPPGFNGTIEEVIDPDEADRLFYEARDA